MSFVERVNQGESLASGLNWLTEPPAVSWSLIMGHLSAIWKRGNLDPSKCLQNGSRKLCCAQHALAKLPLISQVWNGIQPLYVNVITFSYPKLNTGCAEFKKKCRWVKFGKTGINMYWTAECGHLQHIISLKHVNFAMLHAATGQAHYAVIT